MKPPLHDELTSALVAVLGDMQRAIEQLAQVLEEERAALGANDSDSLDQAGTRKQALMLQLEQLDSERQQLGREQPAIATSLEPDWAKVLQSLRQCHQLNQRNGSTVSQRLSQVRQALSVLTGHPGEGGVYSRTGELHASLRSQVISAA